MIAHSFGATQAAISALLTIQWPRRIGLVGDWRARARDLSGPDSGKRCPVSAQRTQELPGAMDRNAGNSDAAWEGAAASLTGSLTLAAIARGRP